MVGFGNEFQDKKQNSKTRINKNAEKIINQAFFCILKEILKKR